MRIIEKQKKKKVALIALIRSQVGKLQISFTLIPHHKFSYWTLMDNLLNQFK